MTVSPRLAIGCNEIYPLLLSSTKVPYGQFYGGLSGWEGLRELIRFETDKKHVFWVPFHAYLLKPLNFSFRKDNGSFLQAAQRCVGAGKCRRIEGGAMCPSYRATGEEKDSTRGRSRLLFEMMNSDSPMDHTFQNEHVKEALDTCLS